MSYYQIQKNYSYMYYVNYTGVDIYVDVNESKVDCILASHRTRRTQYVVNSILRRCDNAGFAI